MNQIKFRAWDKVRPHPCMIEVESVMYDEFDKMSISGKPFNKDNGGFTHLEEGEFELLQYFDLQDKNDVDYCVGDLVNVFFTSDNGNHIHDCIYEVQKGALGAIEFRIRAMMWESYGWNQHTLNTTLSEKYSRLSEDYLNIGRLMLDNSYGENHAHGTRWKEVDESRYFEIIGNIHQNPELIK
jgi:uncharacterized phage protein (TIGR01671 family)